VVVVVWRIAPALLAEFTQILLFPNTPQASSISKVQIRCRHAEFAKLSKARLHTGIRGDIVTTLKAPGVLTQSLGISERLEWLSEVSPTETEVVFERRLGLAEKVALAEDVNALQTGME
jgi:hypothetical protein